MDEPKESHHSRKPPSANHRPANSVKPQRSGAGLVASGILLSRLAGFARDRALAYFLGNGDAADAFRSALRIPNFLQNLFGEGLLSASFIPVYSRLLADGKKTEAKALAVTVGVALSLITAVMVFIGLLSSSWLITVIAPGFAGEKRELTLQLVQLFFPAIGILVLSAWCLGVLNSHRRFFLSYSAPVLWNLSIVGFLLASKKFALLSVLPHWGEASAGIISNVDDGATFSLVTSMSGYAWVAGWGLVVGSVLQFLVQLPSVLKLLGREGVWRVQLDHHAREVFRNFTPSLISRGVVQISAYIDNMLASLLATGAVSAISFAQTIYLVPISLFGMSISAAELPEMSRLSGDSADVRAKLQARLANSLNTMAFAIIPSSFACLFLSELMVGGLYETGQFTSEDTLQTSLVVSGFAIGLLAASSARLVSSTFYALGDPRTPLRFAVIRVFIGTALGFSMSRYLPEAIGLAPQSGAFFLAFASAIAAWVEFSLLRRGLLRRLNINSLGSTRTLELLLVAGVLAVAIGGVNFGLRSMFVSLQPVVRALVLLPMYAGLFLVVTSYLGIPQAHVWTARLANVFGRFVRR